MGCLIKNPIFTRDLPTDQEERLKVLEEMLEHFARECKQKKKNAISGKKYEVSEEEEKIFDKSF